MAGGFEEIEGADRIRIEVIEGNGSRTIMRWLGGSVNDRIRFNFSKKGQNPRTITDIEFVMAE